MMIMKSIVKYTSILLLLLVVKTGIAQLHPSEYNIYTQNRFIYNPANTGDYGQAFLDVKEATMGIKGAQEMFTFGIHSKFGSSQKSGIGLLIKNDSRNALARTVVNANYSYAAKLNDKNLLLFGVGAGLNAQRLDRSNLKASDESEIFAESGQYEATALDARFGINYNWNNKLNIGLALPEMLTADMGFNKHFLGLASYKLYAVNDKIEIEPSVLYRHFVSEQDFATNQVDGNLYMCWDQTLWLQGAYRLNPSKNTSAFIIGGGINLAWVGVGYAYEYGMGNDLATLSNGTHEIQLTMWFDKNRRDNRNEELLNNNQLEMMVDSVPQDMDEYYQSQIDSLKNELDKLNNAMKLKDLAEFTDAILDKIRELDQLQKNAINNLNDDVVVFFDVNKFNIKPEYVDALDKFADELKETDAKVVIHGYADETGPEGYNSVLSEKRATAVKDYLVRKGVKAGNIDIAAHGETTEFGVSLDSNRRAQPVRK